MTQGRKIERRTRFFLCCEGDSEFSYGAFLQNLANDRDQCNIHIVRTVLQPGAGSPVALAKKAVEKYRDEVEKHGECKAKALLLDSDVHQEKPINERREFEQIMKKENFIVIWQKPNHEGFLLNHFQGYEKANPPKNKTKQALQKIWNDYDKPMTAESIHKKIGIKDVCRRSRAHSEFRRFLKAIGLIC